MDTRHPLPGEGGTTRTALSTDSFGGQSVPAPTAVLLPLHSGKCPDTNGLFARSRNSSAADKRVLPRIISAAQKTINTTIHNKNLCQLKPNESIRFNDLGLGMEINHHTQESKT
ncbi:unnamed protein product [Menidia menidia]|uniref:(Atlantic silverside) hypothetical protein n=1 Tax=Menidia menidia TaxID=238744 RepID=A0A8S4BCZ9_9TELE|nr:unnamed protein product [Menidia menidia]